MKALIALLLLVVCLAGFCLQLRAQEIIAHRGASFMAPENTLASVKLGYAEGADAVEIDIHLSSDQRVMVIHDKDTKRTARGNNKLIKETDAANLRQLEVGSWKDSRYRGEKIPFLEEVLALVPEDKKLVIELKTGPEILPALQDIVDKSGVKDRLIFISFNKESILQVKQLFPAIPAYWLLHSWAEHSVDQAIAIAKKGGLEGLNVNHMLVTDQFMEKMNSHSLKVYVYTVNDAQAGKALAAQGVKGITTDRPQWLRAQLAKP